MALRFLTILPLPQGREATAEDLGDAFNAGFLAALTLSAKVMRQTMDGKASGNGKTGAAH